MQTISYSNVINETIKFLPNIGNVILYDEISNILFGKKIKSLSRLELLNKKFIINLDSHDGEVYFDLSKFEEFLRFVNEKVNWEREELFPLNYFDCLEKLGLNVPVYHQYVKILKVIEDIKSYLQEKEDKHAKVLLKSFWDNKFNGVIADYNANVCDSFFLLTFKFPRKNGLPLMLNLTDGAFCSRNTVSIDYSVEQNNYFDNLYQEWVTSLLMETQESYCISCLEVVTGSYDLAKMIFSSHSTKEDFIINVKDLNQIIGFKNDSTENEYFHFFQIIYPTESIFTIKDDNMMLNFEGFNKYLLNLETKYLKNFEAKEMINTLYYNVMDELVNSYKKLYSFYRRNLIVENECQFECME